jgi:uncharacterized protein YjbI with pentapeptide repeats
MRPDSGSISVAFLRSGGVLGGSGEAWRFLKGEAGSSGCFCAGVDLAGEDLSGDNLAGEDLAGEDLAGEDLAGEDLAGEDLAGEDLSGEDLAGEDLAGEDLSRECPAMGASSSDSRSLGPSDTPLELDSDTSTSILFSRIYLLAMT